MTHEEIWHHSPKSVKERHQGRNGGYNQTRANTSDLFSTQNLREGYAMEMRKERNTSTAYLPLNCSGLHCQMPLLQTFLRRPQYRVPRKFTAVKMATERERKREKLGKQTQSTKEHLDPIHVHLSPSDFNNCILAAVPRFHSSDPLLFHQLRRFC